MVGPKFGTRAVEAKPDLLALPGQRRFYRSQRGVHHVRHADLLAFELDRPPLHVDQVDQVREFLAERVQPVYAASHDAHETLVGEAVQVARRGRYEQVLGPEYGAQRRPQFMCDGLEYAHPGVLCGLALRDVAKRDHGAFLSRQSRHHRLCRERRAVRAARRDFDSVTVGPRWRADIEPRREEPGQGTAFQAGGLVSEHRYAPGVHAGDLAGRVDRDHGVPAGIENAPQPAFAGDEVFGESRAFDSRRNLVSDTLKPVEV